MKRLCAEGAKLILRPKRAVYNEKAVPTTLEIPNFGFVDRIPLHFIGSNQNVLIGSLYTSSKDKLDSPCVIYLHDSSSNQFEGQYIVSLFVPIGINVFCFDFSGSGNSEGDYISLGYYERDDTLKAISICKEYGASRVALWGRSMGAATALLCLDADICGVIVDTPYSSLQGLYSSIAQQRKIPLKSLSKAIQSIEEAVFSTAHFKMSDVVPINLCHNSTVPVFLIHSNDDAFIPVQHSFDIFDALPVDKRKLILVNGPHEAPRSDQISLLAAEFIASCCGIDVTFEKDPSSTSSEYIPPEQSQTTPIQTNINTTRPRERARKDSDSIQSDSTDDIVDVTEDSDDVVFTPPSPTYSPIGKTNQSLLAAPILNSPH